MARAKARLNFVSFVTYTNEKYVVEPVHRYVADRLQAFVEACERKESPRLIIKMPPQHGKSTLCSRALPGWVLGRNPAWRVVLMSYSADWARGLSKNARDLVVGEKYRALWPGLEIDPSSTAADDWGLTWRTGGGSMVAVGRDGSVTGRSAEVLIVDDPVKNRKEANSAVLREETWNAWTEFRNRVQEGGGVLILYTPWHHDDLPSRLLAWQKEHPDADQYEVITLTALGEEGDPLGRLEGEPLAPGRFTLASLLKLRATIPVSDWEALYCGRPTSEAGAVFQAAWLRHERYRWVQGPVLLFADTAYGQKKTSDYSVIQAWRVEQNAYRLLDQWRMRADFPTLKTAAVSMAAKWRPVAFPIEAWGSGVSLIEDLLVGTRLPVLRWRPDQDKVARANAVTPEFQAGKVILPTEDEAPWVRDYVQELLRFPAGPHDDQCFVAGTRIATPTGDRPIEQLRAGEKVLTPFGPRRVLAAGSTGRRPVIERLGITGTPNHPVFCHDGWLPMDMLTMASPVRRLSLWGLIRWQYQRQLSGAASPTDSWAESDAITSVSRVRIRGDGVLRDFMWRCGSSIRARRFHLATTFITVTATRSITTTATWSAYRVGTTARRILSRMQSVRSGISPVPAKPRVRGIDLPRVVRGIGRWLWPAQRLRLSPSYASGAEIPSPRPVQRWHASVDPAASSKHVPPSRGGLGTVATVFNLSIEDTPAYYANGVLVHNCDVTSMGLSYMKAHFHPFDREAEPVTHDFTYDDQPDDDESDHLFRELGMRLPSTAKRS